MFAFTSEIDAWLRSAPREADTGSAGADSVTDELAGRRGWLLGKAAAAVAVAGAIVLAWPGPDAVAPARVDVGERNVVATDEDGRQLWEHPLEPGHRHDRVVVAEGTRVVPGEGGAVYFGTSNRMRVPDNFVGSGELTSLTLDGRPRWTFRFGDGLTVGGKPFGEPWAVTGFAVEATGANRRIAVTAHHWLWPPSILAVLDDTGKRLGTYVNYGWVERVEWLTRDRLAFSGFHSELNGGLLGLLDPAQLDGQSPAAPDSPTYCQSCGAGRPLKLVVMPRSEVNRVTQSRFNRAIVELTGDGIIARTIEVPSEPPVDSTRQGAADALYEFTANLDVIRASFSQRYWDIHAELEAKKLLDHDREHCPDRDGPRVVHTWSPNSGWRETPTR